MPELRILNYYNKSVLSKLDPKNIPITIPKAALDEWQGGDTDPYYKVQEIEYPITANGLNYTESFFDSYISKLKERPIPGSKNGHETSWGVRPNTDFIMVGARMQKNGDGTGKIYFKTYIPKEGNEKFIKENKTGLVHYSLVAYTRDEMYEDSEGNIVINVIESLKGERNDAVEYGLGAMEQKTNITGLKEPEKNREGNGEMTKKELLEKLQAMKANADITLKEVAEALGLESQLLTSKHEEALKVVNALAERGVDKPLDQLEKMQADIKANAEDVRRAKLDNVYGIDEKKQNYLRQYADKQTAGLFGDELEAKINELKEDPIAKKLAQDKADYDSDYNTVGIVEQRKINTDGTSNYNGRRVDVY